MKQNNIIYPTMISGPTVTWRDKLLYVWNRIPFWIPVVSAIAIICTVFLVRNLKQIDEVSDMSMAVRALLPEEASLLEGMYCIRSLSNDGGRYSSAEVSDLESGYRITVYSDYAPLSLEAELLSDGTMRCESLGEGTVIYKPSTGSINIVFTKEGTEICEFSK